MTVSNDSDRLKVGRDDKVSRWMAVERRGKVGVDDSPRRDIVVLCGILCVRSTDPDSRTIRVHSKKLKTVDM